MGRTRPTLVTTNFILFLKFRYVRMATYRLIIDFEKNTYKVMLPDYISPLSSHVGQI